MSYSRKRSRHLTRYRQIAGVLMKYKLAGPLRAFGLDRFLPLRLIPPGLPWQKEARTASQRTRLALEELGTTFVKVGQILSTRTDMMPSDFVDELAKLQDDIKPLPAKVIEGVISEELGRPVREVFASFDQSPIGVASIGQAHAATLHDGTEVVVKTRKPGVVEQVTEDLDILRQLAESRGRHLEYLQQYDVSKLVDEVATTIMAELDYIREGHSAEHFARFFQDDPMVHVPKVFWEYTTSRVITLERIRGFRLTDSQWLEKTGADRRELARRCVNIWLKMIFEDVAFHADPHPGNVFLEADGRLGLIDFGMVGMVDDEVRGHLAGLVKAFLMRDADLLIDELKDLGAVPRAGYDDVLRNDIRRVLSHYYPQAAEFRSTPSADDVFAMLRRNRVQLPANLFLILKTGSMVQAIGLGLDPDYDFFGDLQQHTEEAIKAKYSPAAIYRRLPAVMADFAASGIELPRQMARIVKSVERGDLQVRPDMSALGPQMKRLERLLARLMLGALFSALIVAAALIFLALRLG